MADRTALILAVASNQGNLELLTDLLTDAGYQIKSAENLAGFDRLLEASESVALAVLDIDGFTSDIWVRCERLDSRDAPILVPAVGLLPRPPESPRHRCPNRARKARRQGRTPRNRPHTHRERELNAPAGPPRVDPAQKRTY